MCYQMYTMNQRNNARQMLGITENATREEITQAFKAKVCALTQENTNQEQFHKQLGQLYRSHELLLNTEQNAFHPLFTQMDNYMRNMQTRINDMFNQPFDFGFHANHQLEHTGSQSEHVHVQPTGTQPIPHNYKYARSFTKSITADKNGHVIGNSTKTIQNGDKTFKEEKNFDSTTNNMHIRRTNANGVVKEYDKPFHTKKFKLQQ